MPLALATTRAHLRKTTLSFKEYHDAYEQRLDVDPRRPLQLQEHADRTLYTRWNLTHHRLESDSPRAAQVLKLLACFDNQMTSFDLLHAGLNATSPDWLKEVAGHRIDFENVMGILVDYCLIEVQPTTKSYSMHACIHDWTLLELNRITSKYWLEAKEFWVRTNVQPFAPSKCSVVCTGGRVDWMRRS